MLIVFGGLPGVGKTTLAKAVAREWDAVYLRVDTIEQALRFSERLNGEVGSAGYLVYRLLNPLSFVAFKMGRLRGVRKEHI